MHSERPEYVQYVVGCISLQLSVTCTASVPKIIQRTDRGASVQRTGLVMPEDGQETRSRSSIALCRSALTPSIIYIYIYTHTHTHTHAHIHIYGKFR
jgi:hypothetical protein